MQINPYLFFQGTCEEAMTFYAKTLGGTMVGMMMTDQAPPEAQAHMGPEMKGKVMHACLQVGQFQIMASDAPAARFNKPQGFDVSLQIDDMEKAKATFDALSEGGTVNMPFGPVFWGRGFGACVDKFGTPWMVNCA